MKQLPLAIQPLVRAGFGNYLGESNLPVVASLRELLGGRGEQQLYLWSPLMLGKSHLLQAICHEASERGLRSAYVPLAQFVARPVEVLEGLERMDLVCIDDTHRAFGSENWEEGLFDLINRCREWHCPLVFASAEHPKSTALRLPDLRSRLLWGPVFRLQDLDDREKQTLLHDWLQARGLELEPAAANYLMQRQQRDLASMRQILELLDRESLIQQRRLSVPFIRSVLDANASD